MTTTASRRLLTVYLPLSLAAILLLFPFYWMLITSIKTNRELIDLSGLPFWVFEPTLEHYRVLFAETGFLRWALNTLIVSVVATAISLACSILAGYTLARLRSGAGRRRRRLPGYGGVHGAVDRGHDDSVQPLPVLRRDALGHADRIQIPRRRQSAVAVSASRAARFHEQSGFHPHETDERDCEGWERDCGVVGNAGEIGGDGASVGRRGQGVCDLRARGTAGGAGACVAGGEICGGVGEDNWGSHQITGC